MAPVGSFKDYQKQNPGSKTIIVTGASAGIGNAVSKYLIRDRSKGANNLVIVTGRNEGPLLELQALEASNDARVVIVTGDMNEPVTAQRVVHAAKEFSDRLDGLILNHGTVGEGERISKGDPSDWTTVFQINVVSYIAIIKEALPRLRKSNGRIIMTSSGLAQVGQSSVGAYGASKAALNHLAMTLKVEEPQVTTIAIRPGKVDTNMQGDLRGKYAAKLDAKDSKMYKDAKDNNELLKPEQPAYVMASLVLSAPSELSGRYFSWNDQELGHFQNPKDQR